MDYHEYPILYVDDESANRVVIKHNLGKEFTLLIADSAEAALEILASEFVAVLLADQRMPRMTGVDLAEQTLKRYPDVIRVIITAYSDLEATIDAINRAQVNRFIKKPWTREELAAVIRESIQAFHNARLLKQMQQRQMQLDRATSVAVMASAIGHDLRQPLGWIEQNMGCVFHDVRLLEELELSPPDANDKIRGLRGALEDVKKGVDQFKKISSTLYKSIRTQEITRKRIDLRQVVDGALSLTKTLIIAKAVLDVEVPDEEVQVLASEGRLLQLLVNLVVNATQAIEGPKMANHVRLRLRPTTDRVIIEVEDTGCGIPHDQVDQVFAPFFTTKGEAGSGLGLPICKQVVDELEGTITVRSTPGQGSCFVVSLPRCGVAPEPGDTSGRPVGEQRGHDD